MIIERTWRRVYLCCRSCGTRQAPEELLSAIEKLKNKSFVSPEELSELGDLSNDWIEGLDLENAGIVSVFGTIDIGDEKGISKGVAVKRKLKSEYASLIRQIADNNVTLTPEQLTAMYSLD